MVVVAEIICVLASVSACRGRSGQRMSAYWTNEELPQIQIRIDLLLRKFPVLCFLVLSINDVLHLVESPFVYQCFVFALHELFRVILVCRNTDNPCIERIAEHIKE